MSLLVLLLWAFCPSASFIPWLYCSKLGLCGWQAAEGTTQGWANQPAAVLDAWNTPARKLPQDCCRVHCCSSAVVIRDKQSSIEWKEHTHAHPRPIHTSLLPVSYAAIFLPHLIITIFFSPEFLHGLYIRSLDSPFFFSFAASLGLGKGKIQELLHAERKAFNGYTQ